MSNKHKHYEMIVAKAENFDLIQFIKLGDKWEIVGGHDNHVVNFGDHYQYFLCLPQHKEACLHWLNGGEVECTSKFTNGWEVCGDIKNIAWCESIGLMRKDASYRIKPKKEKRWIATFPWSGNVFYVTPEHFETKEMLSDYVYMYYGKQALMVSHQIEVEV